MSHSRSHCDSIVRAIECVANVVLAAMLVLALSPMFAEPANAQSYTLTLLYSFTGPPDGDSPRGIVLDSQGNLYGSTQYGGLPNCGPRERPLISCGTVFKLDTSGQETVLHKFTFSNGDGMVPLGSVIRDSQGNLYGTTNFGGDSRCFSDGEYFGCGIVFKLDPSGRETVLHTFEGASQGDGAAPAAPLVQDGLGNLYGTTSNGGDGQCNNSPFGGPSGCGTVFKIDTSGHETVLYRFIGGNVDGKFPSGLILDAQGNLYGTTTFGGTYQYGIVFKVNPSGNETVLYSFRGIGTGDGATPISGLTRDAQGNLYGTTLDGGINNCDGLTPGCGTVFKLSSSGQETVLYRFTGTNSDGFPHSTLVLDNAGNLYGLDGTNYFGIVFRLDASGHETVLYSFEGIASPAQLLAIPGQQGSFYGALYIGAYGGPGAIFKLAPSGQR
jgi:uncharacterized repeat protein (TIGR03803 family)